MNKTRAFVQTAILLMIGLSNFHAPAFSAEETQPNKSLQPGAKDLFFKQKSNPGKIINTGVQYYIELKRGGKVSNVSNKFAFRSGDSIRIHVTSNTDAFAYILLQEGSRGEQSVLFPDSRYHDNNRLKSSVDYAIPQDGYLTFDRNPGTESVLVLLSRKEIDPNKYLADKTRKHVIIASARDGSKDLIPGTVVLSYSNQDSNIANLPEKGPGQNERPNTVKPESGILLSSVADKEKAGSFTMASSADAEDAITTLVQKDPEQVLAVDMALLHGP